MFLTHLAPDSQTALFYKANASQALAGREAIVSTGGILGGGSSINFAMYTRAQGCDYDSWKTEGWDFKRLLPYLKKVMTSPWRPLDQATDIGDSLKHTILTIHPLIRVSMVMMVRLMLLVIIQQVKTRKMTSWLLPPHSESLRSLTCRTSSPVEASPSVTLDYFSLFLHFTNSCLVALASLCRP